MVPARFELLGKIARDLSRAKPGSVLPVDEMHVLDVLPHHWREEDVDSIQEWFIKYCRAFGLHATYDGRRYKVRLTRDVEDEATITWPGKKSVMAR